MGSSVYAALVLYWDDPHFLRAFYYCLLALTLPARRYCTTTATYRYHLLPPSLCLPPPAPYLPCRYTYLPTVGRFGAPTHGEEKPSVVIPLFHSPCPFSFSLSVSHSSAYRQSWKPGLPSLLTTLTILPFSVEGGGRWSGGGRQ